ncbi:phage tail tube protein [Neomegalonema sp.]|uniref:phage tail tube protein n=1 Tax=Neomegalonema sp. TaxID=2039713 RepID=UPI00262A2D88|nr:phage tail tube protein [Neomegalonema sp.]MDD2870237.1 phage tail tube protein [Neomegalonema sp.]
MSSNAGIGWGIKLEQSADGTAWTELAEVSHVTPPNYEAETIDVTHYQSEGKRREFISGLSDGGTGSITLNHVPGSATETLLISLQKSGEASKFRISWPKSGPKWVFEGIVASYAIDPPVDGKMTAEVSIKVTGDTTITPAGG